MFGSLHFDKYGDYWKHKIHVQYWFSRLQNHEEDCWLVNWKIKVPESGQRVDIHRLEADWGLVCSFIRPQAKGQKGDKCFRTQEIMVCDNNKTTTQPQHWYCSWPHNTWHYSLIPLNSKTPLRKFKHPSIYLSFPHADHFFPMNLGCFLASSPRLIQLTFTTIIKLLLIPLAQSMHGYILLYVKCNKTESWLKRFSSRYNFLICHWEPELCMYVL